ncbi:plasma membrane ascorbate-dependent reductase CYBRD1-like isoform X2 [Brevipalpus obovatus]|uniref:plasma membrane ascorbate-dependent reductase CYBRD1-like isoform X2 n=1 Tax=Brevipalpus obovatus TaxID=246614 RepID=UPI003D9E7AB1
MDDPKSRDELQRLINEGDERMDMEDIGPQKLKTFQTLFMVSQVTGLLSIILTVIWVYKFFGGLGLSDPDKEFNFHPILMIVAFLYMNGNSILIYRYMRKKPKPLLKWIHSSLHGINVLIIGFALFAVIDYHNRKKIPNFYSIHSWLGIAISVIYGLQSLGSFAIFMKPGASDSIRKMTLPLHVFGGISLFFLSVATILMGFTEKMIFKYKKEYAAGESVGIYVNFIGIFAVLHAFLVGYMMYDQEFKRRPLPEDRVGSQPIAMTD